MDSQRTKDLFLDSLKERNIEGSVLICETKMLLDFGSFCPQINIRVWETNINPLRPYWYEISHYVKTPSQCDAYRPSNRIADTALGALEYAISDFRRFIDSAIAEGKAPNDTWILPNKDY